MRQAHPAMIAPRRYGLVNGGGASARSALRQGEQRGDRRPRRFLRDVVADAGQHAALVAAAETAGVRVHIGRRSDAVIRAAQRDRRRVDRRPSGEPALDRLQRRIARRIAESMAIGVNDHLDEIRIVEREGRSGVDRIVERPRRRPQAPSSSPEVAAVGGEAVAAARGVEIILVPEPMLGFRRLRRRGAGDVLDRVAAAEHQAAHALRPQRGDDAGRAAAPVVAREDAIVLYGFVHDDERRCFEVLLSSHGVGPALALAIMASLSPASLSTAVLEDDVQTLCTVPGVGRKTAAGLLIELKSRLDLPDLSGELKPRPGTPAAGTSRSEARAALAELGYAPDEIRAALEGLHDDVGVEEMLRLALRELASR